MASIINPFIFNWQEVESRSDMDRLELVLNNIPDEGLMKKLEEHRGRGRNDYPVRCMWNSLIAGVVFQHESVESLRRELSRNGELRSKCGFDPFLGSEAVPTSRAFNHFLNLLLKFDAEIRRIFDELVETIGELLPDFGERTAVDSKALDSAGKPTKKEEGDGRRDVDADWGVKKYSGVRKDGSLWEKVKRWFGYKLHLIVDSKHELPLEYKITKASSSDVKELMPMLKKHEESHPTVSERAKVISADKGYDDTETITELYDEHGIKPVIDIRNMWRSEGDEIDRAEGQIVTRQLHPDNAYENIMYDYKGTVYCWNLKNHEQKELAFGGFEKDRQTLKYICPAKAYGIDCCGKEECLHFNKTIRIPLKRDRRIFTPIARSSYKWNTEYNRRSAVERVNSRFDVSFGWKNHFFRGMRKVNARMGISLIVMLASAVGSIKAGRMKRMRSLVRTVMRT